MTLLAIVLILMIIGAIIAIETTNLLSSIVCVGAVGFLVSVAFLFLGAPDLAITQLVVEILCLVILIRATINRDLTAVSGEREFFGLTVTLVLILLFTLLGINALRDFPVPGEPVMVRIADTPASMILEKASQQETSHNVLSSILLNYRNWDMLGQIAILFCAVLGALAILRRPARKGQLESDQEADAV